MKKGIVLDIGDSPILSSCPSYSYKTLLLQNAGREATNIFLANHFTNCIYEPHFFDLYEEDYLCMKYNLTRDAKLISDTLVLLMEAFKKEELLLNDYIESIS